MATIGKKYVAKLKEKEMFYMNRIAELNDGKIFWCKRAAERLTEVKEEEMADVIHRAYRNIESLNAEISGWYSQLQGLRDTMYILGIETEV